MPQSLTEQLLFKCSILLHAAKTFQEYVNIVFAPHISTQLGKVHRLDLVDNFWYWIQLPVPSYSPTGCKCASLQAALQQHIKRASLQAALQQHINRASLQAAHQACISPGSTPAVHQACISPGSTPAAHQACISPGSTPAAH